MTKKKKQTNKSLKVKANEAKTKKPLNLKAMLLYVVVVFLFQEMVMRFCFPVPELSNFNRINYQILEMPKDGPKFLRNVNMTWRSSLDTTATFVHAFNKYGYRDKDWKIAKPTGKTRVMFIGDSFIEGMMSTQDKTITEGFKKAAGDNAEDLDIFNCGMMGIGLNEYMKFIGDATPIFKPDLVMLVLYSNDIPFQRAYKPAKILEPEYHSFLTPRLKTVVQHIQNQDPIPFKWGKPTVPFYKPVPDPSNPWTSREKEMSQHVIPAMAQEMKRGNFNYFRANWILEEEKFLKSQPDISGKLAYIKNYLKEQGCDLAIFYIPSRSQVSDYYYQFEKQACLVNCPDTLSLKGEAYQLHQKVLTSECAQQKIPFFDLTPKVKMQEDKGNHLYWNFDDHMRGKGYMMLGREIFERFDRLGGYE